MEMRGGLYALRNNAKGNCLQYFLQSLYLLITVICIVFWMQAIINISIFIEIALHWKKIITTLR